MSGKAKRKRAGVAAMQVVALEGPLPRGAGRTGVGMLKAFGRAEVVRAADGAPLVSMEDGTTKIHPKAEKVLAGRPFAVRLTPQDSWRSAWFTRPTLAKLRRMTGFTGVLLVPRRVAARRRKNELRSTIQVESRSEKLADRVFAIGIASRARMCSKKLRHRGRAIIMAQIEVPEAELVAAVRAVEALVRRERQAVKVRLDVTGSPVASTAAAIPWSECLESEMINVVSIGLRLFG